MIRSSCFAIGLFILMWGATFLSVERVVFKHKETEEESKKYPIRGLVTTLNEDNKRELSCPDWGAFTLMSVGTVTMLYAVALPRR